MQTEAYTNTSSTSATELCHRFCNGLRLSNKITMIAVDLAEKMSQKGALAGRSPLSAAAACIYMVSHLMGDPKSPKEIAQVAGVSDGTIRTAYKFLYQDRDKLIDQPILDKGGDKTRLPVG